jgi:hypothetical protein
VLVFNSLQNRTRLCSVIPFRALEGGCLLPGAPFPAHRLEYGSLQNTSLINCEPFGSLIITRDMRHFIQSNGNAAQFTVKYSVLLLRVFSLYDFEIQRFVFSRRFFSVFVYCQVKFGVYIIIINKGCNLAVFSLKKMCFFYYPLEQQLIKFSNLENCLN